VIKKQIFIDLKERPKEAPFVANKIAFLSKDWNE
jgi:hypothetical protein